MTSSAAQASLLKVLCESCLKQFAVDCLVCGGSRFYFWDPNTSLCYCPNGEPMLAADDDGELVGVRRSSARMERASSDVSVESMLAFIELWASEDPVRKWKMWVDDGWHCCFWKNRHLEKGVQISDSDPVRCIAECYARLIRNSSAS